MTGAAERIVQHNIRLVCGRGPTVLWRNETGVSEHGWRECTKQAISQLRRGNLSAAIKTLTNPKLSRVRYGLCKGSADLIGLTELTIGPEHVGKTLAVFVAVEVKRAKGGRASAEQLQFLDLVRRRHGIAIVARSPEEVNAAITTATAANALQPEPR